MVMFTRGNGTTSTSTATANRFGLTERYIRDNGDMTRPTVKVSSHMPMETFMMVISKTIRLMALVFTNIIMAQFTKVIGNSMLTTGKESNPKVMAPNITGYSRMVKSMVRDTKYLQKGQPFKESGIKA